MNIEWGKNPRFFVFVFYLMAGIGLERGTQAIMASEVGLAVCYFAYTIFAVYFANVNLNFFKEDAQKEENIKLIKK